MTTVDLRRELPQLYRAAAAPALVDVPPLDYLMIDGPETPTPRPSTPRPSRRSTPWPTPSGSPSSGRRDPMDAPVMPLEGLWWVPDMSTFSVEDKSRVGLDDDDRPVPSGDRRRRRDCLRGGGAEEAARGDRRVRLERFAEGRAAQILHVGPYSEEGPTIAALHRFIAEPGCRCRASTTRSTSAIRAAPRRRSCARSSASRSASAGVIRAAPAINRKDGQALSENRQRMSVPPS